MIYGGCNCGNCHLTILPTGDIYACRRVQNSKVGNVFDDRIADVWICQMEQYRDYTKFEKCSKCELLAFCRDYPREGNPHPTAKPGKADRIIRIGESVK